MKYKRHRDSNDDVHGSSEEGGGDLPPSIRLPSVRLDTTMLDRGGGGALSTGGTGGPPDFFAPWAERTPGSGSAHRTPAPPGAGGRGPPEKRLTLFALRLAVLEKAASGLGALDFVWATVVLLGGFASDLRNMDFWCVTVILVGEGARVFSRSHELEWQHHATQTSTAGRALRSSTRFFRRMIHAAHALAADRGGGGGGGGRGADRDRDLERQQQGFATPTGAGASCSCCDVLRRKLRALVNPALAAVDGRGATPAQVQLQLSAVRKQRAWNAPEVSLLPYTGFLFASRNIGRLLLWLQVLSALCCVALSLMRLCKRDFILGVVDDSKRNMRPALLLFYTLALLEASLFLLEKAYWTWRFSISRLLHQVNNECQLGDYGLVSLTRFFYEAYSRCIAGSIFDGIKMDLFTFAEELILSDFLDEQIIGVRILDQLTRSRASAGDTMRKIATNPRSVERLVEMLNWTRAEERQVRLGAAEVVSRLAGKRQNALRLSGIPGAMESIMSLLRADRGAVPAPAPVSRARPQHGGDDDDCLPLNVLGLGILKNLARDHDNCGKIGSTRGLLAKVVDFTHPPAPVLRNPQAPDSQVRAVKRALQVVRMLVSTTGSTGKALRRDVAENVFAVSNLRDILRHGPHRDLRRLAIAVLAGLAMDDVGKAAIVGTGGVVGLLLAAFADDGDRELGCEAGEALAMLALESEAGCAAILSRAADVLDVLVSALRDGDPRRRNAAWVLRSLCAYAGPEHGGRLRAATTKALPVLLAATMEENYEALEASIGLTVEICGFIEDDGERFAAELRGAGVEERAYVHRLAAILRDNMYPEIRVPRMRRFVVQQVVWLMKCSRGGTYTELLREVGVGRLLESIADTTSDLECYHVFSGSVGIGKHRKSLSVIVDSALELITGGGGGPRAQG